MSKLLLVDDEFIITAELKALLEEEGYEVVGTASSGEKCVELARRLRPDLILMDIVMPGRLDGIAAAKIIKEELDIPVIFISAHTSKELIQRVKSVEPFGYIVKPFQERELKVVIDLALYKRDLAIRLKEGERRYALAINAGNIGVWDWNIETDEVYIDPHLKAILGYKDEDIPNTINGWNELVHPHDIDWVKKQRNDHLKEEQGNPYQVEYRLLDKEGNTKWFLICGSTIHNQENKPLRMMGTCFEITENKRLENELKKIHDELEKRVKESTARLIQANRKLLEEIQVRKDAENDLKNLNEILREKNRELNILSRRIIGLLEGDYQKVAHDLHDQVGQTLATLKMDIEIMLNEGLDSDHSWEETANSALSKAVQAMREVKEIAQGLSPTILTTLGLIPAIQSLLNRIQQIAKFEITFFHKNITKHFDEEKELAIYRIIQESLTNTIKHGRAKHVYINLMRKDSTILLSIEDDGIGFDFMRVKKNLNRNSGLGLLIMRERVTQLDGKFSVESRIQNGVHLLAEIPI